MTEPSHPSPVRLLKYGLNPQQGNASLEFADGVEWLRVLNGTLGYINVLDALKAWQLARELGRVFGRAAAASIKHVHPAGAAVAAPEVSDGIVAPGYAPAALQILRRKKTPTSPAACRTPTP